MDSRSLILCALAVLASYLAGTKILAAIAAARFQRAHGCEEPPRVPQSERLIGYGLFQTVRQNSLLKKSLEASANRAPGTGLTASAVVMGQKIISTIDAENVKAILATHFKDFGLGPRIDALGPLLGSGIFTADGVHWEHSRSLVRPAFTKSRVANLPALEPHIQALLARIPTDGTTVDLQPLFFNLLLDTATEFLFGESVHSQHAETDSAAQAFPHAFDAAQAHVQMRSRLGRFAFLLRDREFPGACRVVHDFVDGFVFRALEYRKGRDAKREGGEGGWKEMGEGGEEKESYIFLNQLAEATDDPKRLRDELLNILLAARDTTAGLLSNAFHALARNPRVWKRLQEEVGGLGGKAPDYEALKNMQYLKWFLNEALRLYPSVPNNARFANKPTLIPRGGGPLGTSPVYIPAGAVVYYSVYAMHRRPDIWGPTANDFIPERWAPDAPGGPLRPGWAYLPFNGGPRVCVGQQSALTEAGYTIVRLLQRFAGIESRDPGPWREQLGLTLSSSEGTKVAFTLR